MFKNNFQSYAQQRWCLCYGDVFVVVMSLLWWCQIKSKRWNVKRIFMIGISSNYLFLYLKGRVNLIGIYVSLPACQEGDTKKQTPVQWKYRINAEMLPSYIPTRVADKVRSDRLCLANCYREESCDTIYFFTDRLWYWLNSSQF